jgi:phage terminase small subunit
VTPKQVAFIREYLVDLCGAKAAVRAGYLPKNAKKSAHELMQKPAIREAIDAAMEERAQRTLVTADENLKAIEHLANAAEAAREFSAAIRARELIGRHHRSFTDKVELTGKNDGPVEYTEIRRTIVDPKAE